MRNDLYLSKIRTNVPGFDDLFHGGLRLPDIRKDKQMDGICIVIYGERGVAKSDMAMQIMRGVDKFFKQNSPNGAKMPPRFCSLNHRESEWKKHFCGAEVVDMIDLIKAPEDYSQPDSTCKLCAYFNDLRSLRNAFPSTPDMTFDGCQCNAINSCPICKLIRHGIIVFNARSQSLHWNVGSHSDMDNYVSFMSDDAIDTSGIFRGKAEDTGEGLYEKTSLQLFNEMREEIYDAVEKLEKSSDDERYFYWSSCVMESFTDFSDDDLERLPYSDLMRKLRKAAAVSILVFDERGEKLHLNADIILHMTKSVDPKTSYQYQEMHIVKSDCQPHVQGWHKYRTVYGMKIIVYPSIPYLLQTRFEIDNAVARLEHESLRYPQWLMQKFQTEFVISKDDGNTGDRALRSIAAVLSNREGAITPYDEKNTTSLVQLIESDADCDKLYAQIDEQVHKEDTTVAVFLFGKSDQEFRKRIGERNYPENCLKDIHYWEATSAYLWPEYFASVVRRYIARWKNCSHHHHLHIIVDDFGKVGLYPLMNNEPLLPFALANICRNATALRGWEGNSRGIHITLSMLCTNKQCNYYQTLFLLKDNQ